MATQQEVIKNFMGSLDKTTLSGTAALNEAMSSITGGAVTSIQTFINQMVADCKATNNATNFLNEYCGIILPYDSYTYDSKKKVWYYGNSTNNKDTGAITGKDAGGSSTEKTAESIVSESDNLKTYTSNSVTSNGVTFELVNFTGNSYNNHYKATTYSALTDAQKYIWNGLNTWWAPLSLSLIKTSYGNNYGFDSSSSATIKTIHVGFANLGGSTLALVQNWSSGDGKTVSDLDLKINMQYYSNIDTSDKNGKSNVSGAGYLDRTLAHEFTHAVMATNINYFSKLPQFIKEGMAELTHGIDDERGPNIYQLAGNSSKLKSALNLKNTGTGTVDAYAGGYMFLRYLAKEFSGSATAGNDTFHNYINSSVVSGLAGNDTITNRVAKATIDGDAGNDYLINKLANVSIFGGAGNDTLKNTAANVTLTGGAGDDSIIAGSAKNTIKAGAGNDTITGAGTNIYMFGRDDGNNVITKITKNDTIFLQNTVSKDNIGIDVSGTDKIITAGSTKITVQNAAKINFKYKFSEFSDDDDDKYTNETDKAVVLTMGGNDTVTNNANKARIDGGNGNDSLISASNTTLVTLIGGDGNDVLTSNGTKASISGGAGNDKITAGDNSTILGGAGNDTVLSSGGKNTVVFGNADGNNSIKSWNAEDTLWLTGTNAINKIAVRNSGKNFSLGFGDTQVTLGGYSADSLSVKLSNKKFTTLEAQSMSAKDDYYVNLTDSATISMGAGNDTVYNWGESLTVDGGAGDDYLYNNEADVTVVGGAGNDTIALTAAAKNNVINYAANSGNDIVTGFTKDDTLNIGNSKYVTVLSGKDVFVKLIGSDTGYINLKNAKSVLTAANIMGTLYTGGYNDSEGWTYDKTKTVITLKKDAYFPAIDLSKEGYERVVTFNAAKGAEVTVKGNWANNVITGGAYADSIYGYSGNNNVKGGNGNDTLLGGKDNDILSGGNDNDHITAGSGNNKLSGDNGNDTLIGGTGKDTLLGGAGNDYLYDSSGDNRLDGGNGNDSIYGGSGNDFLLGGNNDDYLSATSGNNKFDGGNGNDTLIGGTGDDSFNGGAGNDYISAGSGNNTLLGGAGNDTLKDSTGDDVLTGGAGNDIFYYSGGNDIIKDYTKGDSIIISGSISSSVLSGNNLTYTIGKGSLTLINAKNKVIDFSGTNALITEQNDYADIDDIIEDNFAVAEFEIATPKQNSLQSAITYADK